MTETPAPEAPSLPRTASVDGLPLPVPSEPIIGVIEESVVRAAQTLDPTVGGQDAMQIALMLDHISKGMDSLHSRLEKNDDEGIHLREVMAKQMERMEKLEKAMNSWQERQTEWRLAAHNAGSDIDPQVRARAQAQAMKDVQQTAAAIRAEHELTRVEFAEQVKAMPEVTVMAPGRVDMVRGAGGSIQGVLMPTVIIINGFRWDLPPGRAVKVPMIVAQRLEQVLNELEDNEERKALLSGDRKGRYREEFDVAKGWQDIGQRHGIGGDQIMISGGG